MAPRLRVDTAVAADTPAPAGDTPCDAPQEAPCDGNIPATPRSRVTPGSLAGPAVAALAYTAAQLRAATPLHGAPPTAEHFYGDRVSLLLPAVATAAYLAFCTFGPRVMASRRALSCKSAMLVYNAYQALFNAVCVGVLLAEVRRAGLRAWGNQLGPGWRAEPAYGRIAGIVWLHYNNKYVELLDSVFMVLRKKTEQLSFLHCYHHCLLIWAWLLVMKTRGCVDSYFGVACNGSIHVLMYSYYLLASLGVRCPWKRYLTQAQMAQFCACAAQSLYILAAGDAVCPIALPLTQLWVMTNMLFLFARFYMKQYKPGGKHAAKKGGVLAAPQVGLTASPAGPARVARARRAD